MSKAIENLQAAQQRAMAGRPKVGGLPYLVETLRRAGSDIAKALDWLDTAYRLPDPGIGTLRVDELIDPLRKQPRFQEIERRLQFPN
jgi:hypothetical protein